MTFFNKIHNWVYPSPRMADPKKVRVLDTFHIFQQPELRMLGEFANKTTVFQWDWVRSYYTSVIFPEIYIYVFRCISDYTTHLMHEMFIIYLDTKTNWLGWRCNDQCPNPLTHNSYSLPRFCSFLLLTQKAFLNLLNHSEWWSRNFGIVGIVQNLLHTS